MLDELRKLYDTFKTIGHINLTLQNTLSKPEVQVNTTIYTESQRSASSSPLQSEQPSSTPRPAQVATRQETETEVSDEVNTEILPEPDYEYDINSQKNAEFITEPEYEAEPDVDNSAQPVSEIPEKENLVNPKPNEGNSVSNVESAPATLADKFNTGNKSLSETIVPSQAQAAMGSRLQFQPISDLITGIGLNDKFSFISDLFGNNAVKYDEAIHRINKAVNLDEANWILQKYHSAEWEHKHETLARMKDFVKRRFV